MKIYELIKGLNKKIEIPDTKIMEVKKHYLSLYRAYMVWLYDDGFISDPTVFNKREILGNIVDMEIKYLSGISGKIELSEEYIGYALAKYKNCEDEEITKFLSNLYGAIKYRTMCLNIDKFYEEFGYEPGCSRKVSLGLTQMVSRIMVRGGYVIDEAILKCFNKINSDFEFISMDEEIYGVALEELGITDDNNESLFVQGLTGEEEIKYSNLILNGLVKLDGKYADKLSAWLKDNKWSGENKFSSKSEGLYNWVVYVKSNDMMDRQAVTLNSIVDSGRNIACMLSNGFYVLKDGFDTVFPVGMFAVNGDSEDGELLPEINKLEGYTGEVYSVSHLVTYDLGYVGCPILLYVDNKDMDYFVDKEQTEFKDSVSWFKYMGVELEFGESEYKSRVFAKDSLEDGIFKAICDAEEGKLIGEINSDLKSLEKAKKSVVNKLYS